MDQNVLWDKCMEFHGHECGGLTIGYKAALYAIDLLGLIFSPDEQLVCIAENDACSIGKGNLMFHMTGKQAFSFYNRTNGKSARLMLKRKPDAMTREESFAYYQSLDPAEMFDVMETTITLPESARIFDSYVCDRCGETAGTNWMRLQGDEKVCIDCFAKYDRFDV